MKHFTVIELGEDSESPMIGTIDNVTNNKVGKQLFEERLTKALEEHFDADVDILEIPDLFAGSPYEDMIITVEGEEYKIRILETWIY
jgi:mannose/fructose-specific phosphotransferase system component IIA